MPSAMTTAKAFDVRRVFQLFNFLTLVLIIAAQLPDAALIVTDADGSTPSEHRLPQALIIGVKKCGTRALLEFLRLHPNVSAPGPEIHFFDRHYDRGLDWYRRQMPTTTADQLTIEKTPSYFIKKEVPQRIWQMSPDTKLLVVVRDPVTRALSDYTQSLSKGHTNKSFDDMAFVGYEHNVVDHSRGFVRIGLYAKYVRRLTDQYFPLSAIHFVNGERLISDPAGEMKKVERFLQLPAFISREHFSANASAKGFPCVKRKNQPPGGRAGGGGAFKCLGKTKGRTHPHVSARTLALLRRFYLPHNRRFFDMVGEDFGWNDDGGL